MEVVGAERQDLQQGLQSWSRQCLQHRTLWWWSSWCQELGMKHLWFLESSLAAATALSTQSTTREMPTASVINRAKPIGVTTILHPIFFQTFSICYHFITTCADTFTYVYLERFLYQGH